MRVLVTGHNGYIGSVMVDVLVRAGHDIVGLDTYLFEDCTLGAERAEVPAIRADLRDLNVSQLAGFDAVIHLAALSNDPLGNLNPQITYDINHLASVRLARLAREAGVKRFLFASSCSLYGVAANDGLLRKAAFDPSRPAGKVLVERDVCCSPTIASVGVSRERRLQDVARCARMSGEQPIAPSTGNPHPERRRTPWQRSCT